MANALLTPKVYADTMLVLLKNELVVAKKVNTSFKDEFKRVGDTVSVKKPPEFIVANGPNLAVQDVIEGETTVKIDQQKHVDVQFSSLEDTLTVSDLLKSAVMKAAAAQLAQTVESAVAAQAIYFPDYVGTPGTTINNSAAVFRAAQRLVEGAVPMTDINAFLSPADGFGLAQSLTSLNSQDKVAPDALTKAKIPMIAGLDSYYTQSIATLTTGTRPLTGATVNGAGQNVTYQTVKSSYTQSLVLAGLGAGSTVVAGDVFTLAGVYDINPRTKAALPYLKQFVVQVGATADGAGAATLTIGDPIITSGAFQNCTTAPANGAAVVWLGAPSTNFSQNFAFNKQAITLTFAKLTKPFTGECEYSTDPDTGISLRYWKASDINTDVHIHRWDILFGTKNVDSRLGTRFGG